MGLPRTSFAVAGLTCALALFVTNQLPGEADAAGATPDRAVSGGQIRQTIADDQKPGVTTQYVVTIGPGDTIFAILGQLGISREESQEAIVSLLDLFEPADLKPGEKLIVDVVDTTSGRSLRRLEITETSSPSVVVRYEGGRFATEAEDATGETRIRSVNGIVSTTLLAASAEMGVPDEIVISFVELFSGSIDFSRDVQPGDSFKIMFEETFDTEGNPVRLGAIVFAEFVRGDRRLSFVVTKNGTGNGEYFTIDGTRVRHSSLQNPVAAARISSTFGRRVHPVLGVTRMHRGMDFAAAKGVPVYAAAEGTVDFAARNGGFGNFIKLKHSENLATSYAHLARFADGIRAGDKVGQGQLIGYVGTTGLTSGPNLHYEVLVDEEPIDPIVAGPPVNHEVVGEELTAFWADVSDLDAGVTRPAIARTQ